MGRNRGSNEYYMPREYYDEPREYREPREHIGADEYTDLGEPGTGEEPFDTATSPMDGSAKKRRRGRGKLRKMVYLLASAVAAVNVAAAAIPQKTLSMISVSQYDQIGYSNGGVIPVCKGNTWSLLNLAGDTLYTMASSGTDLSWPNEDGRSAFRVGSSHYVVVDRTGKEVWSYENEDMAAYESNGWDRLFVTEQNYMLLALKDQSTCIYADDKGNIIFDEIPSVHITECAEFSEGYAVVHDAEKNNISLLGMDGSLTEVYQKDPEQGNADIQIIDAYADGYFLYLSRGDYVLYHTETGQGITIPRNLSEEEAASLGGVVPNYIINYNRFVTDWFWSFTSTPFKRYHKNNVSLAHRGTYYCRTLAKKDADTGQQYEQDFLFDISRIDDTNLLGLVATYDTIYFDDSPYLLVCQDGEYFYIDWDGNEVSRHYQKATSFSDQGYALVMDREGWAYVIDENLKQVERIADVTDLEPQAMADVFVVYFGEEKYVCFYGESE